MEGFAILALLAALVAFLPIGLVSAARQPDKAYDLAGRSRRGTVLGILVAGPLGGFYYWLRIRPDVREASKSLPPRPRVPMSERWRD